MKSHYDLIVVGTGFASSFFLHKYLESAPAGASVLVLERGVFRPHAERVQARRKDKTLSGINWTESQAAYENETPEKHWVFNPNFGGGSNCWTGCTPRFMPNDFRMQSTYGVGMDWPFGYDELAPYYDEAERLMNISGPEETPFPKEGPYPLPAHALSETDKLLQQAYGTDYISQPTARASQAIASRGGCCSSAVCSLCPVNAKYTIENGFRSLYEDERVEVVYEAQAYALHTNGQSARSLVFRHGDEDKEVMADAIGLGANAIFNAHILLNSGDSLYHTGRGLSEQVGMYMMVYLDGVDNVGGGSIIPANGYMLYDGEHRRKESAILIESHNTPFIRSDFGKWRQIARYKFVMEDIPREDNRVMTTGDPLKPKTIYKGHSDFVNRTVPTLAEKANRVFSPLPVERIDLDGYLQKSEYHICSTHRMSAQPGEGVTDAGLVHHRYRNVFVLGSGAFPTMSPANPTLTLAALSLRAADKAFNRQRV
ncbi:GMC oxidoreductase [Roseivirga sp. BDSF3-8]|uniref:GMC oxidoreductase n=1 Tax=Roseivirga sp. BDSF3-8 TaxID=3241598 RepID=UPI00353225D8